MEMEYCPWCMTALEGAEVCPRCGKPAAAYVPSPHHLPPGTVLAGRYTVGGVIGEGGFGITYVAYDRRLARKAAVKEYYPLDRATRNSAASLSLVSLTGLAKETFERGRQRFLDEARIMARLEKQPAIVGVLDHFEANNTAYIVMEYVEGVTLKQIVERDGPMAPEKLLPLMEPVFRALSGLHESGLIHRDISPDNLMLENGAMRLLDFGCAREADQGQETLTIAIKHGYAPIEQYRQKGQGPWTDVYALGATIYFGLTGKAPPQPLDRVPEDTLLLPTKLGAPLTKRQELALLKALRIQTRRRFQSMEDFRRALYKEGPMAEEAPWETGPDMPPVRSGRWSRRRAWVLGGLGVAAAACLAAAVALSLGPRSGTARGDRSLSRLFEGGTELADDIYSRDELMKLMDDETVPSVILRSGATLDLNTLDNDTTVLEKPLLVEEGATLCANLLTVPEGGTLLMEGTLDCRGLVTLEGSGERLRLEGRLSPAGEETAVFLMDERANLLVDDERLAQTLGSRLVIRPEAELAYEVTDLRTLNEGLRLHDTLMIRGSIALSQWYDISGKTLFIGEDGVLWPENTEAGLQLRDSVLVNSGQLLCGIRAEDSAVLNYGGFDGCTDQGRALTMEFGRGCTLLNYGELVTAGGCELETGAQLTNLGRLATVDMSATGGRISNLGDMDLPTPQEGDEQKSCLSTLNGTSIYNSGTFTVCGGAYYSSDGWLVNDGCFQLDDGAESYLGAVYNRHGEVAAEDGASVWHGRVFGPGVISAESGENIDWRFCGQALPLPERLPERTVTVQTEEELRAALEGDEAVFVPGDLVIMGPVEIGQPLYIGGSVTAGPDAAITVSGTALVLYGEGSLEAAELRLLHGAGLLMTEGSSLTVPAGGELYMADNAILTGEGRSLDLSGARLTMEYASFVPERLESLDMDGTAVMAADAFFMLPGTLAFAAEDMALTVENSEIYLIGPTELTGCAIDVTERYGSVRITSPGVTLRGCTVTTEEECEVVFEAVDLYMDGDTVLDNGGHMWFGGWGTASTASEGTIVNRSRMEISGHIDISQPIQNSGELIISERGDGTDRYTVEGEPAIIQP